MNLDALWHDLECGGYDDDLPLWRAFAARTGGPVLDVGAGTGRVSLDLAAAGADVIALDFEAALLDALAHRGQVQTVVADAREFTLDRQIALVVVPMQTLQLLDGTHGRAAFLRRARAHLLPGGLLVAAIADALECFDEEHSEPPPPSERTIAGVRYATQLRAVDEQDGRAALRRRRTIGEEIHDVVVHLDRVTPDEVEAEAAALGFAIEPRASVPESEQYLGSTVIVLRSP